jgi:hypothetical protein
MRVTLKEHGGLAAAINRTAAGLVADTRSLPAEQAETLVRLVTAALDTATGPPAGPGRGRDAMSYTVTVESDAGTRTLTGSDLEASGEFTALLRWLQDHARR